MAAEPLVPLLESALPSVLKLAFERRRISLKNEGAIAHLRKESEDPDRGRATRSSRPLYFKLLTKAGDSFSFSPNCAKKKLEPCTGNYSERCACVAGLIKTEQEALECLQLVDNAGHGRSGGSCPGLPVF